MTPKEKAAELINKMFYTQSSMTKWSEAKQCALIAVDEVIDEIKQDYTSDRYAYWHEVKAEIEKL